VDRLLSCPFCGKIPEFPDGNGTQYEIYCDCGHAMSCIQISDTMTIEERMASNFEKNGYRYEKEYINRAKKEATEAWNKRAQPDIQSLTDQIKAIPWTPWVKALVQDRYGIWIMCGKEPRIQGKLWIDHGKYKCVEDVILSEWDGDWRESKVRVND